MPPVTLTNPREALAFFLAQAIKVAIQFAVVTSVLLPIYLQMMHGGMAISVMLFGFAFVMWIAAFPLFMLFRALFGAVPGLVAAPGRERAFTSSGGEVGAYALTYVIVTVLSTAFSALVAANIYAALRASGRIGWVAPVSLTVTFLFVAIFFLIFIGLRRAFAAPGGGGGRR